MIPLTRLRLFLLSTTNNILLNVYCSSDIGEHIWNIKISITMMCFLDNKWRGGYLRWVKPMNSLYSLACSMTTCCYSIKSRAKADIRKCNRLSMRTVVKFHKCRTLWRQKNMYLKIVFFLKKVLFYSYKLNSSLTYTLIFESFLHSM